MPAIKIGILEDDHGLRAHLSDAITDNVDFRLEFAVGTLAEALKRTETVEIDLCLVDICLPDGTGFEFISYAKEHLAAKILILTVLGDRVSVLNALSSGADGYLLKDASTEQLERYIKSVFAGETPISPQAATHLLQHFKQTDSVKKKEQAADHDLTHREMDVLNLFAQGHSYKETAAILDVTMNTIGTHVKTIYRKLQVNSRGAAVYKAEKLGVLKNI